ncbi:hypothetical protein [Streptomyces griseosporeus]|uniref:hypothetical protein n=1 Tax=Streptomyces griseosporeus TaxID=1910 RepID=UPI003703541D
MPDFTRGFRLRTPDGDVYDGARFPSGRYYVLDHPERGLATAATSLAALLEPIPDASLEWDGDGQPPDDEPE